MMDFDFKQLPTTRYQGSKRKIIPWIYENIKDMNFTTALDVFGGTGSVSYLLKKMNKEVTYNDKLHFNHIIGRAIIENSRVTFTEEDINTLLSRNDHVSYDNIIQRNFKDIYYLNSENRWLDTIVSNTVHMNHYRGQILEYKKALAYYAIFQSCLIKRPFNLFHRKNLNLRTNEEVERNFGNKTTWDKPFELYLKQFINEANKLVFDNGRQCQSLNESVFDIDPYGYDLVYFDPPYISKKSYHESSDYLRCYHFLEGLSNYADWEERIDRNTSNHRLININEENDFKSDNIMESFEELLSRFQNSIIVLSYKKGGNPSISQLSNLIRRIKGNVRTVSQHYKYALNRQNGDSQKNREVLIIGE